MRNPSPLSQQLTLLADRIHLAEAWLVRGEVDRAREYLADVHRDLVALAEEVDR